MRAFTWPKLIGSTVALMGTGGLFSAACDYWPLGFRDTFPLRPESWVALVGGVSLLALSYPLYRASDWARRVLFVLSLSICLGFAIILSTAALRRPKIAYDGPSAMVEQQFPDFRLQEYFIQLTRAGEWLFPIALSAFLTIALLHPDVVRAFRERAAPDDSQNRSPSA